MIFNKKPTTLFEKKAAAIYGHPSINPIYKTKILKNLDTILTLFNNETDLYDKKIKEKIRECIKNTTLDINDTIELIPKTPILTIQPLEIQSDTVYLETYPITYTNLKEFEYICFGNKLSYRYMDENSFPSYLYLNLLHSLNATDPQQLIGNNKWQAKLAILLKETNLNNYVATAVFYHNTITYNDITYDVSYVPKYDVSNLKPQNIMIGKYRHLKLIDYYYDLDVENTRRIKMENIGIFLTFPFKNGYYIQPNGDLIYLNLYTNKKQSIDLNIDTICYMHDIEFFIDLLSRYIHLDDAINYALYAKNLTHQAIALLIIRRLVGNVLVLGSYEIHLASELTILSWTQLACGNMKLILPNKYLITDTPIYVSLINDIAASCFTKKGASILCSSYFIPEVNIHAVYKLLKTDAEKYVFFTLLLQTYIVAPYYYIRNTLKPQFGRQIINLAKYPKINREYNDSTIVNRLDSYSEPLLKPTDVNADVHICPPYKCIDLYEFSNEQLKELVTTGDTILNNNQLASFLSLIV